MEFNVFKPPSQNVPLTQTAQETTKALEIRRIRYGPDHQWNDPLNHQGPTRSQREGTLRVLRAARNVGVKRTVVTSSFAAIGYGQGEQTEPFTAKNWTNVDGPGVSAYVKSKAIAERVAWDFIEKKGGSMELAVVNPVAIYGPVLDKDYSASVEVVYCIMNGAIPECPQLEFGIINVRDVAD